ncbi:MAG: transposase domain-containing protein [Isosphaeraceae bacterium]
MAVLFSVVSSCQRNGHDPFAYLRDVLAPIPDLPKERLAELLPDRWSPPQAADATTAEGPDNGRRAHGLSDRDPPSPSSGPGEMHRRVRFQGHGHLGPLPGAHSSSHPATAAVRSAALRATGGAVAARGGGVQRTHTLGQLRARREQEVLGIGQCARGPVPQDRVMRVELRHTPEIAPGTQPGARLRTSRKALAALPYSFCSMKPAPWK